MGQIRKQTIQSSFLSYAGFLIGAINTYFFTKQGLFTPEQYGLTQTIISITQMLAPVATLGATVLIGKFYPYYFDRLENRNNDMLGVSLIVITIGAILVFSASLIFEPLVIRKFSARSSLVVTYYYWSLLYAFCYLCFMLLEAYLGSLKRTVIPNFMKETVYRSCVSVLIILYAFQVIGFALFVKLFCSIYLLIVVILIAYLMLTKQLHLTFRISGVTRRLKKQIRVYVAFVYSGIAINGIARQIDTLAVAGARTLAEAGIYTLNQFSAAILQVPYRALIAIAGPTIAQYWKDKKKHEIDRIYKRASINMLLISSFLFLQIWLNYDDGLAMLGLDKQYSTGKMVFLILGIYNIMDLTLGISGSVISTSPAWRFEFYSGIVLLLFSIPLNIFMARWQGMTGVALATLITFTVYNTIRVLFVRKRFGIWPFTIKTLYAICFLLALYFTMWLLLSHWHGITAIFVRAILLTVLFVGGTLAFKLTPDFQQVTDIVLKKLKLK